MNSFESKKERLQALETAEDIQYILNEAYKILGNPILAHDMEYKLISYTENIVTDDPIWNEYIVNGTVGQDRLEFFKNECFLDTAANAKKVTFLRSEKLKCDRIYGKIFSGDNVQVGCVCCIKESHKPFDDDDIIFFELFCDVLNKVLAKSEYYRKYGQEYQELLINKLIEGSIEDKEVYTAHIESIYISLKDYLNLAVVDISQCDPTHAKLSYFRDLFKRQHPDFKYAIYANYILIIISSDDKTLNLKEKGLGKMNKIFKQHNIYAGISSSFDNLFELQKYYIEAVNALSSGLKSNRDKRIFFTRNK